MSDWNHYYYRVFPNELREFAAQRVPEHHCPHCQAQQGRRCRIDERVLAEKSAMFRFAWYGITLLDQGLFTYFPEASQRWVEATGGYPLPVEQVGFGCVRVAAPSRLLSAHDSLPDWERYIAFWLEETDLHFERMSGISPHAFFALAARDRALEERSLQNRLEPYLLRAALGRFAAERNAG